MSFDISLGLVRGLLTAVLLVAFVALWIWTWSSKRQPDFAVAARLPLDDEPSAIVRETEQC